MERPRATASSPKLPASIAASSLCLPMSADAPEPGSDASAIDPLHRIGLALTELDPERLIQHLTDEATAICRAQFGAFFYNVVDRCGGSYMLYTLSGAPREAFSRFPMPRATEIFRPTFDGTEVLRLDDVTQDPRFGRNTPHHGMPPGHLPVRSYLAVPVLSRTGQVLGGLFFGHAQPGIFTADDEHLMVAVASQTGLALDNARLHAAVEAREQQYRFLADAMPQNVYTARPGGQLDYVNAGWTTYTELTLAQTQTDGWDAVVHPDDRGPMRDRWTSSLATGEVFEHLYRIRRASDGAYRWHLGRSVPRRSDDGEIVQWVGTSTDVDDQQRSSDALRFLAAASAELSASLDYRGALTSVAHLAIPSIADFCIIAIVGPEGAVARLAAAHVDATRVAQLEALADHDLGDPDAAGSACQVMRTSRAALIDELEQDPGSDDPRRHLMHACGARSWLCVPIQGRGRTIGAITFGAAGSGRRLAAADLRVAEDLAVRVSVAVENARLYHDAQEANRAKDQFLATVSHELRTPLTAILGWTRMLRSPQLDDERRRRGLETIERSARAQTQLIEDLLDISRIISGKLRLEPRSIDPVDPIDAAFEAVLPTAEAKNVRMTRVLATNAGPIVADPDRLQQVVWNLLTNAVKFTPRGGAVEVRLRRDESSAEITVSDTGQGIPTAFLRHVFELFRQADAEFTRKHGGLGIGLAITRHLVELHGGTIAVESEGEGRGATFIVRLPLGPLRIPSESSEAPPASSGELTCPVEIEGLRVLIVDDEPDVRELLTVVLERCKVIVFAAASAQEALALLQAHRPHVLVSDIGMPGEDGYALIRQVRALPPEAGGKIPALALTAYARMEDRTRALLAGFQMHVPKPLDPTELVVVLANLTDRVPR